VVLNETLVKIKYALGTLGCAYFCFSKCQIQAHDGANAEYSTNLDEIDYSVVFPANLLIIKILFGAKNVSLILEIVPS
jgi:hypothetical protein